MSDGHHHGAVNGQMASSISQWDMAEPYQTRPERALNEFWNVISGVAGRFSQHRLAAFWQCQARVASPSESAREARAADRGHVPSDSTLRAAGVHGSGVARSTRTAQVVQAVRRGCWSRFPRAKPGGRRSGASRRTAGRASLAASTDRPRDPRHPQSDMASGAELYRLAGATCGSAHCQSTTNLHLATNWDNICARLAYCK